MKKFAMSVLLASLLSACAASDSPAPATEPAALGAALDHLRLRQPIQHSQLACISAEENPVSAPADAEAMAFAEGLWQVESRRLASAFDEAVGGDKWVEGQAVAAIQPILHGNGYVEYYVGVLGEELYLDTAFWGASGLSQRWLLMDSNSFSRDVNVLRGDFEEGRGFQVSGELFGSDAEISISEISADNFFWKLSLNGETVWSRNYTRLADRGAAEELLHATLGEAGTPQASEALGDFAFWVGEWDWIEHHIELPRECAAGQADIQWTNNGLAIEERVTSSYDPVEAGVPTYVDYSLTVWDEENQQFKNYWWTIGSIIAYESAGTCGSEDGQKTCYLRARFRPSEDEDYIDWQVDNVFIEWFRKED